MGRPASLYEQYGEHAAPPERKSTERLVAEQEAERIFDALVELVPPNELGQGDLRSMIFALEDLGSVDWYHVYVDPESSGPDKWRSDEWYDDAEFHYDKLLHRPGDLPGLIGAFDWDPETAGDLIAAYAAESERFGGTVPDWLFEQQIADQIHPDPRYGKLVLRVVPKEVAYDFVRRHHSALKGRLAPGLMYAIGAFQLRHGKRPRLVAVALAGHPTAQWPEWLQAKQRDYDVAAGDRPAPCHKYGVLDLTRVASVGGIYTRDRKGRKVPINASSMLTSRVMDLLPISGRHGHPACLFVTYSMPTEKGTTYLSLVSKGLRPVYRRRGQAPSGARAGGTGAALSQVDKIRWEYGPAALPPDWSVLEGVVPPAQIDRAAQTFEQYARRAGLGPQAIGGRQMALLNSRR